MSSKSGIMVLVTDWDRNSRSGVDLLWPGLHGVTQRPGVVGAGGVWIRDVGVLPSPGLIVDFSAITPFSLAGLGLARVRRRGRKAPVPVLSHLALDLSNRRAVSIMYQVHPGDVETPLARGMFPDEHPATWTTALTDTHHVLLTVAHCAPLLDARTPQAAIGALDDAWTGLIGCDEECVTRSKLFPAIACTRHSRLRAAE
ncbi:hypothetical protein [Rhodococcus sp. NPDC006774]|uniref:hypothetical protein n=1 Tax=Rhodococcus sp. NPDC006774 TaxID=3157186 RepID=UPI0033ED748F